MNARGKAEKWITSKFARTMLARASLAVQTKDLETLENTLMRVYAVGYCDGKIDELAEHTSFFRSRSHG